MIATNPAVMKKLNLSSGYKSVSRIPFVSIIGLTALNKIVEVATSSPMIMSFIIHDDNVPDDTANGLTKKISTRRRDTPKMIQEYLVFSLYWTM